MNTYKAIGLKIVSALLFALMSALVRLMGEVTPVGQLVFFRSLFAVLPVLLIYAYLGKLREALYTKRPLGQLGRGTLSVGGMYTNFAALTRLPLADATAIQFASPLITVGLAALFLKEQVHIYRWSAVVVGFIGIFIMLVPHLDVSHYTGAVMGTAAVGALLALTSAFINAGAVIQTRRLTRTETTPSIVFYFSLVCAIAGAVTLPFAWYTPSAPELAILITLGILGGLAHIFLTESYRFAPASVIAPFDYTAMLWALLLGYWVFGEVPSPLVFIGGAIVIAAGLFVIWRERVRKLRYARAPDEPPSPL